MSYPHHVLSQGRRLRVSPIGLFSGGASGALYDPASPGTLFQDTGKTTPADAYGDPVRVMADISGNGLDAQAPSDAARPLLARMPRGGKRNFLIATATMSTQNVTTIAQAYTLSFTGTGTVTLSGTSTDGPLVGTGVGDRVTLTFTPTAGTLTLTVSGSVTLAQLEAGSSATNYQAVGAGAYDCTESGVPDVDCLLCTGALYMTIPGSASALKFMHTGTGGYFVGGFAVNKYDDGNVNIFVGSTTQVNTNIGMSSYLNDISTSDGRNLIAIANGSGTGFVGTPASSNLAIPRYTPFVLGYGYDSPDITGSVDGSDIISTTQSNAPSSADSSSDMTMMATPAGTLVLPCAFFGGLFIDSLTDAQEAQATRFYQNRMGV